MKVIHQFGKTTSVTTAGTGDAYSTLSLNRPHWRGFQLQIVAAGMNGLVDGDQLRVEGDGRVVIEMLQDLLSAAKSIERGCRRDVRNAAKRSRQCGRCSLWFDERSPTHGDGTGKECRPKVK